MEEGDILRQRRNLVAMSCLLIIFDLAKVEVAKVGVLGTDLIIGDVRVLAISMWVVWAYFLLRYYQFWRKERPHLSVAIYEQVGQYAYNYAHSHKLPGTERNAPSLHRPNWIRGWRIEVQSYKAGTGGMMTESITPVSPILALLWKARAWIRVAVHTPYFTEYALPLVLAAATPVIAVLTVILAPP